MWVQTVVTPFSKAAVNPYRGDEIPRWDELGLDPNKVYRLLRDPVELEKAAPTFAGKPLLWGHRAVTANDHDHELACGALGSVASSHCPFSLIGHSSFALSSYQ